VRRRLLLSYLLVAALVLGALEIPLGIAYARNERQDLTDKVERDAVALSTLVEDALERGVAIPPQVRSVAEAYDAKTGGRVVVVDQAGRMLVDTSPTGSRSFASRPEFAAALAGQVSTGTRHSNTLGTDLLYVAVPVASTGVVHGAVRITYPMSDVTSRIHRYWSILGLIAASVLLASTALAYALARWVSKPLDSLERAAEEVGSGNLSARAPVEGPPEVQRLVRTFNDTAAALDHLVRAQDRFVADASHQLRTPLAALRLRLENLERDVEPSARAELDGALAEVERLSSLVDALLVLARADRAAASPEPIDVGQVVDDRVSAWRALADDAGIVLDSQLEGPVTALATPGRLEQVLDNLLANALDASPPGSTIRLDARRANGLVEVHVTDEGPGMSAEERAQALDRFWRGDGGRDGFGLGLSIVERLVSTDGGHVELRQAASGGLDAVVVLRVARGAAPTS
jgi:signal transduction histidine kinase